jgi:molybdopterin biosynthesis enzyme
MTVEPGEVVAGVKVTPLVAREKNVREAETIATRSAGIIRVLPFAALPVGVVIKETLGDRERERVIGRLRDKIAWFGGEVIAVDQVPDDAAAVGAAFEAQLAQGAKLLLATGGSALDPFDAMLGGLAQIEGHMERFGAPAHPGSLFWLAYTPANIPIFGVASCGMFSKATAVDLLLPPIFAGEHLDKRRIAALWQGGLLNKEMGFKFPSYEES